MSTPDGGPVQQGRDGGDQHPDDRVLGGDEPEVQSLIEGLTQDDDELVDEEGE